MSRPGTVGHKLSEETKQRISRALSGRRNGPMPEEQKAKIAESNKGRTSEGSKGRVVSEQTRRKMSESLKGRRSTMTEESRRKISESNKGRPSVITEESRRKISETLKRKQQNHKQYVFTEEDRRKMSEARTRAIKEGRIPGLGFGTHGIHYSPKLNRIFHYRSLLELDHYRKLDADESVFAYDVEVVSIEYITSDGSSHQYIPDLVVIYTNGKQKLVEIKPEGEYFRNDPVNLCKFGAGVAWATEHGMTFEVWGYKELSQ